MMSNTQLEEQLVEQPPEIKAEIVRINTDARPLALQVALLIPIIAGLLGLLNGFRMNAATGTRPHPRTRSWRSREAGVGSSDLGEALAARRAHNRLQPITDCWGMTMSTTEPVPAGTPTRRGDVEAPGSGSVPCSRCAAPACWCGRSPCARTSTPAGRRSDSLQAQIDQQAQTGDVVQSSLQAAYDQIVKQLGTVPRAT